MTTDGDHRTEVEVKASIPSPDWKQLLVAVVSAFLGWAAAYFKLWNLPG